MGEPGHRVAANGAIALVDIRPIGVVLQPEKYTMRTLVCAFDQHDFVAFTVSGRGRSNVSHVDNLLRSPTVPRPLRLWSKLRLVHKPGLFKPDSLCLFLLSRLGSLPLRRFFLVEPRGFQNGCFGLRFQPL